MDSSPRSARDVPQEDDATESREADPARQPEIVASGAEALQTLGRFQIRRQLGRGGFGIVFLAYDPELCREVALKVPRLDALVAPEVRARFHHEARAAAGLNHPNLVQVYEAGEVGSVCYIASAYHPGNTLSAWLKQQTEPVPFRLAAQLIVTLSEAVQHAHSRGVLHRDLKPGNILLETLPDQGPGSTDRSGDELGFIPRVTDFGLAKMLAADDQGQTRSGDIVGTPCYMAPEQASGRIREISTGTDVYGLGAILYESLTRRPPFLAASSLETVRQVLTEEVVAPSRLRKKVPRDLETICLKCLEKEPKNRYASADALAGDLRHFLADEPVRARPVGRGERVLRWCRRKPAVACLTGAILLLVVAGVVGSVVAAFRIAAARDEADRHAVRAERAQKKAESEAAENQRRLVQVTVASGLRLLDEGDLFGALLWFGEALRLDGGDPDRERIHRIRIATVLRQCPRLAQIWLHPGPVSHVAFSPDGRHLVTAGDPRSVRVWNTATGEAVTPVLGRGTWVSKAVFSPGGKLVVTAGVDGTARLCRAETGEEIRALKHGQAVVDASFSPGGRRVLTASNDGTAQVWETATGKPIVSFRHLKQVHTAAFNREGNLVVTASADATAQVWNARTGARVGEPLRHATGVGHASFSPDSTRVVTASGRQGQVWDLATGKPGPPLAQADHVWHAYFSPDGRLVLTVSFDKTSQVWDASTGGRHGQPLRAGGLRNAAFSRDGRRILTAGYDRVGRIWDTESGEAVTPPLRHNGAVWHAAFGPDGRHVATAGYDGTTRLWDLATADLGGPALEHYHGVTHAAFSPDGRLVATAARDQSARVWDAANGLPVTPPLRHHNWVYGVAFSSDGKRVVSASADGTARVWEADTGRPVTPPLQHPAPVWRAAFSPDDRRVITACGHEGAATGQAQVWDIACGKEVFAKPLRHQGAVKDACFSPDGTLLLTAGSDHTARIWHARTGQPLHVLRCNRWVAHASFSRDGRHIVTACWDGTLDGLDAQVWDAATGAAIGQPLRHEDGVLDAAFSSDGTRVVTASEDDTARVWDAARSTPITPPLRHAGWVHAAAFSRDGRLVVTASRDGCARVWDATTGHPVTPPLRHRGPVTHAAFSSGDQIVTVSDDQSARLWDLSPDPRPVSDILGHILVLAGQRIDSTASLGPVESAALVRQWHDLRAKYPKALTASADEAAGWYRQEAEACAGLRLWPDKVRQLDLLAATGRERWKDPSRRAEAHAVQAHWRQAADDYIRAIDRGDQNEETWCRHALTLIGAGRKDAFRLACRKMLAHLKDTDNPYTAYLAAWTWALGPQEGENPDAPLRLARLAVAAYPNQSIYLTVLGAVCYRAGRYQDAVRHLHEAGGEKGSPWTWLFLAMAHQRLGEAARAQEWLERSKSWLSRNTGPKPAATGLHWTDWLELHLLRQEAEQKVRPRDSNAK
jgi:WD40 repeat protein